MSRQKSIAAFFSFWVGTLLTLQAGAWDSHYLITRKSLAPLLPSLKKWQTISVTSLEKALPIIFEDPNMTVTHFLEREALSPKTTFRYEPKPGSTTSALDVLALYADEPDWGMDRELNVSPDQRYTGGFTGPTSQGFRHLYFRRWRFSEPITTFHWPPKELGEAPFQVHRWFEMSQRAFKAKQVYWGFRFLSWALHYLQDLGQPFHTNQILTFSFLPLKSLSGGFSTFVKDTTQILANYHWLYESYVTHELKQGKTKETLEKALTIPPLGEKIPLHLALFVARKSSRFGTALGESTFIFFGQNFRDPKIDVPNNIEKYPPKAFETEGNKKAKKQMLEITSKCLELVGSATQNLVTLATEG